MRIALIAILVAGCGSSSSSATAPSPPPTTSSKAALPVAAEEADTEKAPKSRLLDLFTKLAEQMKDYGNSCDKFSAKLGTWLETNGDEIRDLLILDHSDDDHEEIDEAITDVATLVVFGASECGASDTAMLSYDEFDALVL